MKRIAALHDRNDWDYEGWEVRSEELGHDPAHEGGTDYRGARHAVIARLNNGYGGQGTIPLPQFYGDFATRVANFVRNSRGCSVWGIGNEMNHAQERPYNQPITPDLYAQCFARCRNAIKALPGHADDQVCVGAIAPYNNQTQYAGNRNGDWIVYLRHILEACGEWDGLFLHAYTSDQDKATVTSRAKMGGEFAHLSSEFYTYRDQMSAVPKDMLDRAFYITEANPGGRGKPWQDADTGWVCAVHDEIERFNKAALVAQIRAVTLYSVDMRGDGMGFAHKNGVRADFNRAAAKGYEWVEQDPQPSQPPDPEPEPTECQFDEGAIRQIVKEEMAVLYAELRDAMADEVRQLLNRTVLKVE